MDMTYCDKKINKTNQDSNNVVMKNVMGTKNMPAYLYKDV